MIVGLVTVCLALAYLSTMIAKHQKLFIKCKNKDRVIAVVEEEEKDPALHIL